MYNKITILFISGIISLTFSQAQVCTSNCASCNSNTNYDSVPMQYRSTSLQECTSCLVTPNLTPNLPKCQCDTGYFYDGTQCVRHIADTIYFEDFESPTCLLDNWSGKSSSVTNTSQTTNTIPGYSSTAILFTQRIYGGDIFYNRYYQTLKYNNSVIIMFDFLQSKPQEAAGLNLGLNSIGRNEGLHIWQTTSGSNTAGANGYILRGTYQDNQWTHIEYNLYYNHQIPFHVMFQDASDGARQQIFVDNVRVSSIHGPSQLHVSPYYHMQPALMILSLDYTGYDGNLNDQRFHFDKNTLDTILGRTNWNSETFAVYIQQFQVLAEVQMFNTPLGGSIGDSYGIFVTPLSFNDKRYFNPGGYLVFSNNFTNNIGDFELLDIYNGYKGPFYTENSKNLGLCHNNCQDYETLDQAITQCDLDNNCDGILFSHHNYGGTASTGFNSLQGYGYQLRQWQAQPDNEFLLFEYSYIKEEIHMRFGCTGTDPTCALCSSGNRSPPNCLCSSGFIENLTPSCDACVYPCATCSGTVNSCDTCQLTTERVSLTDCNCNPGFYEGGVGLGCQPCDYPCGNCSGSSTNCTSCNTIPGRVSNTDCSCSSGFYETGSQCSSCDYPCDTCTGSSNGCQSCVNPTGRISNTDCRCNDGQYDDGSQCVDCKLGCSTCISSTQCSSCIGNGRYGILCECQIGFYEILNQNDCQQCNIKCLTCQGDANFCQTCSPGLGRDLQLPECGCEDGYYEVQGVIECLQCDSKCQKCKETSKNCIKCSNEQYLPPLCIHKKSNHSMMQIDNQLQLVVCNKKCKQCEQSPTMCLECEDTLNRINLPPQCQCQDGYHDQNGQLKDCIKCSQICQTCLSNQICLTCNVQHNRELIDGQCVCKQGFKSDSDLIKCRQCYYYNGDCYFECPKNTILIKNTQTCQKNEMIMSDNFLLIIVSSLVFTLVIVFKYILVVRPYKNLRVKNKIQKIYNTNQMNQQLPK